jgi:hypothetical protein
MKNRAWHSVAAAVCMVWTLVLVPAQAEMEKADGLMWSFSKDGESATLAGLGLALPSEVGGQPVTRIADRAFYNCHWLKEISISDGVTAIGTEAFAGCSGLEELALPDSVESLGTEALAGCDGLRTLHVPAGWTPDKWADAGVPEGCTVVVGDGEEGGEGGGDEPPDESPWTYTLSDGMATITSAQVEGDVVIPSVLGGCPVGAIQSEAFSSCGGMTSVVIPDSVSNLWMWTFTGATGLVSATLPATLTGLEPQAFHECDALTSYSISPEAANYAVQDGVLFSKDMKTLCCFPPGKAGAYAIPEGTETVADFAFGAANSSVTSLTIPSTVTYLGNFSLCFSQVATLTVPESVTAIGAGVFGWCSGLKTLYLPSSWQSTTMLDDSGGVAPGCTVIYYPTVAEKRYSAWLETLGQTADALPMDGDADLDGASNWEECVAGTDPFDATERFEARILSRDGKMVVEPSTAASGRVYRVHGTADLLGTEGTPPVWDDLTGVQEPSTGDWRYFRVGVDFAQ